MAKKTKVLVLCSRGVNHQDRHLMLDMRKVIPHSKKDCKFDKKDSLTALNEVSSLASCDRCLYFENRKGKILLMWASDVNGGPSAKFHVTGVHTMADVKLIGNCLQGSRPILSFDQHFDSVTHLQLIKDLFIKIFNVPYMHPKSQPFVDHVITFTYIDGRIWFRMYQILDQKEMKMAEIGPRMVLMPMIILSSSFQGKIIWANDKKPTKDGVVLKKTKKVTKESKLAKISEKANGKDKSNSKKGNKKQEAGTDWNEEDDDDDDDNSDNDIDDIDKYR